MTERKRWVEPERAPLPAAITDAWWAWFRGEITFEEYLRRAMAATEETTDAE